MLQEINLNFKISELIHSETALKHNINNMPDINSLDCMLDLITFCLQPIRNLVGKPITITSGYRSPEVNKLVGGALDKYGKPKSQHCKGQAADIIVKGLSIPYLIDIIKNSGVEYDQLINEYNRWVHISYVRGKNRKKVLSIH